MENRGFVFFGADLVFFVDFVVFLVVFLVVLAFFTTFFFVVFEAGAFLAVFLAVGFFLVVLVAFLVVFLVDFVFADFDRAAFLDEAADFFEDLAIFLAIFEAPNIGGSVV